jgi:hypothetical protein
MNLQLGQITLELVLGGYVALAFARRRPWLSGIGLAGAMLKPTFGIPLALLMLVRRDWRAVWDGALASVAVNLPVLLVLAHRAGGERQMIGHLVRTATGMQGMATENDPVFSPTRVDAVALVSRVWGHALGGGGQLLIAVTVLTVAALALRAEARRTSAPSLGLSTGVIGGAILLAVYHQIYDVLFLMLPFVALACRRVPAPYQAPAVRWPLLALFTFLACNYLAGGAVLSRLGLLVERAGHGAMTRQPAAVILSSLNGFALLFLFSGYAIVALRRPPTAAPGT